MALISWDRGTDFLTALPATTTLVAEHAARLAGWYNNANNKDLMANTQDLSAEDVAEVYQALGDEGGHPFLLFRNAELVGDADLRAVEAPERAEFAIMLGERSQQGLGLGTAFSVMVHAYAFGGLNLRRVYLSIVAHNHGARRCYEKVGYVEDSSAEARAYAEDPSDVAMRLDRSVFEARHAALLPRILFTQL